MNRMIVVLQGQWQFFGRRRVGRPDVVPGRSGELDIVLYQYTVVQHGDVRRTGKLSGGVKSRAV